MARRTSGFVYLFRLDRFHKIGSSQNPAKRLKQFENLPWEPALVHMIASAERGFVERLLQRRFRPQRVRGEWFDLTEQDVSRLQSIERLDGLDDFPDDLLPHPSCWREPHEKGCTRLGGDITQETFDRLCRYAMTLRPRKTLDQIFRDAVEAHCRRHADLISEAS